MDITTDRNKLVTLIHAQARQAALTEEEYRMVIAGATDHLSCKDCSLQELQQVFSDLNIILEQKQMKKFFYRKKQVFGVQSAVIARAQKELGKDWDRRLQGFLKGRLHKDNLSECSSQELRQIMGMISAVSRRNNAAAGTVQRGRIETTSANTGRKTADDRTDNTVC